MVVVHKNKYIKDFVNLAVSAQTRVCVIGASKEDRQSVFQELLNKLPQESPINVLDDNSYKLLSTSPVNNKVFLRETLPDEASQNWTLICKGANSDKELYNLCSQAMGATSVLFTSDIPTVTELVDELKKVVGIYPLDNVVEFVVEVSKVDDEAVLTAIYEVLDSGDTINKLVSLNLKTGRNEISSLLSTNLRKKLENNIPGNDILNLQVLLKVWQMQYRIN